MTAGEWGQQICPIWDGKRQDHDPGAVTDAVGDRREPKGGGGGALLGCVLGGPGTVDKQPGCSLLATGDSGVCVGALRRVPRSRRGDTFAWRQIPEETSATDAGHVHVGHQQGESRCSLFAAAGHHLPSTAPLFTALDAKLVCGCWLWISWDCEQIQGP